MSIRFYKGSYKNLVDKDMNFKKVDSVYLLNDNDLYFFIKDTGDTGDSSSVDNMFLNDYINEIFGFSGELRPPEPSAGV